MSLVSFSQLRGLSYSYEQAGCFASAFRCVAIWAKGIKWGERYNVFKGWFFDHIFETRGNFKILFVLREKKVKNLKELYNTFTKKKSISKKKNAFMLEKK